MHDPGHLILRRALRVAIVLPPTYLLVNNVFGLSQGSAYAVFGVFALLAMCDFGGPPKDRATAYLLTTAAGLVAIVLGSIVAYDIWVSIISTFIVVFAISLSTVLRGYVASAQLGVLLPFVIAVTATPQISELWQRLLCFAIAGVIATIAALVLWPTYAQSALRGRVGDTLRASANVIRATWPDPNAPQLADTATRQRELQQAAVELRRQYEGRTLRPGKATSRDRSLLRLIDELNRLRMYLRWKSSADSAPRTGDVELAQVAAETLDSCADAMDNKGDPIGPETLDQAREAHRAAGTHWVGERVEAGDLATIKDATAGEFHLRMTALSAELIAAFTCGATGHKSTFDGPRTDGTAFETPTVTTGQMLRANVTLRSPWFRLALRSGLALSIAVAVVALSQVDHGFWVVLGTLTALKLDALGTGKTALQAISGTVAGFLVGSLVILLVGDYPPVLWVLLPIAVFLSGFTPTAVSLPVGQASFTVFVIVFYGIAAGPTITTGEFRVLDVGIGLVISLVVSALMWPHGIKARVADTLKAATHAATASFVAAYDRLTNGPMNDAAATEAAKHAVLAVSNANETFDLAISQTGPTSDYARAWSLVSNSASHMVACANLITFMARSIGELSDPVLAESLLASAHRVGASVNAAADRIDPRFTNLDLEAAINDDPSRADLNSAEISPLRGSLHRLDENVEHGLSQLPGQYPPGDTAIGIQALAMLYNRDMLIHVSWIAMRLTRLTTPVDQKILSSQPG